ncbi:GspH/FimT family pseudopilin [Colwellia echini]|uniref:Type II secretion system protein H n=1 Tax=Colwellia echini TaxID=1982103 RepID=A0ABY3MT91_9GAMM|nr:GspH/FimT family pseudopilin [Colwellia echini]TYK64390.1 prepilin-type N-terminal cleavage/methylation domain-containing protein [Colwellia echini]
MLYIFARSYLRRLYNFYYQQFIKRSANSSVKQSITAPNKAPSYKFKYTEKPKSHLGMTLIELMVSISITSILTSVALPNFNDFIVQLRVDNEISRISRLLLIARNNAINNQTNVIICPLDDDNKCSTNWHEELSVFIDNNGNSLFDPLDGEILITTKEAIQSGDILMYAKTRDKITYQPTGHLFGLSNGTFRYCPKEYEEKSRGIVVARSGRFYATTDEDNDGRDETRSNVIIECD